MKLFGSQKNRMFFGGNSTSHEMMDVVYLGPLGK